MATSRCTRVLRHDKQIIAIYQYDSIIILWRALSFPWHQKFMDLLRSSEIYELSLLLAGFSSASQQRMLSLLIECNANLPVRESVNHFWVFVSLSDQKSVTAADSSTSVEILVIWKSNQKSASPAVHLLTYQFCFSIHSKFGDFEWLTRKRSFEEHWSLKCEGVVI